jgi:hypothetical protein
LLVIFIITIPVMHQAVPIDLPQVSSQKVEDKPVVIQLALDADGRYFLDGAPAHRSDLESHFAATAARNPNCTCAPTAARATRTSPTSSPPRRRPASTASPSSPNPRRIFLASQRKQAAKLRATPGLSAVRPIDYCRRTRGHSRHRGNSRYRDRRTTACDPG